MRFFTSERLPGYYLVDEGRYTDEELNLRQTPLSGVFSIENASTDRKGLQQAVDRVVAIIQADPNKERIDKIITRWLKRHLQRLRAEINLDQLNSVVEDKDMLAENLENWAQQERRAERQKVLQEAEARALEEKRETVRHLLAFGVLSDDQISEATGLAVDEISKLRTEDKH